MKFKTGTDTAVVLDFDGTVTESDVVDSLIKKFSRSRKWLASEREWLRGAISSDECLARQLGDVRVSREKLAGFLGAVRVDPGFEPLVALLKKRGIPVAVLSDGFDLLIRGVLGRNGFPAVPSMANSLKLVRGRLVPSFPYKNGVCARCANCKGAVLRANRSRVGRFIFIGDGLSDRCAAGEADTVFAKGRLARYCAARRIPFIRYRDLSEVAGRLRRVLERSGNAAKRKPR